MRLDVQLSDEAKVTGIVKVKNFKGHVAKIDTFFLNYAMEIVKALQQNGINIIEMGIENNQALLFFLDKERTLAFAIASLKEED
ncbi:hypothetical protein J7J18_04370 [bacterium]|nr:hypothetical protein [bacterium]